MATAAPSNPVFYAGPIDIAQADAAYPLIRSIAPELSLEDWLDYVERRFREGGLMGLFEADGALIGLFSYRLGERLRHGRVLALDDFVTFELSQAAPGRAALIEAAEALARSLNCTGLEVRLGVRGFADTGSDKAAAWAQLDLVLDSVVLSRRVCEVQSG